MHGTSAHASISIYPEQVHLLGCEDDTPLLLPSIFPFRTARLVSINIFAH